jgi:hypothetical protein
VTLFNHSVYSVCQLMVEHQIHSTVAVCDGGDDSMSPQGMLERLRPARAKTVILRTLQDQGAPV